MSSPHTVIGFLVTVTKHLTETTDLFELMVSEPSVLLGEEGMVEQHGSHEREQSGDQGQTIPRIYLPVTYFYLLDPNW